MELILGVKIKKLVFADKEKILDTTPDGKSVRLDYQRMIDLNSIEKNVRYNSLKKSYVIFICMFEPFEKNLPIYTFSNRCKEMLALELGDETTKVFVNPYSDTKKLSEGIKSFFSI